MAFSSKEAGPCYAGEGGLRGDPAVKRTCRRKAPDGYFEAKGKEHEVVRPKMKKQLTEDKVIAVDDEYM